MMQLRLSLLLLFVVAFAHAQQIQFPREAINFSIDSVYFTIDGYYTFKNSSDKTLSIPISYPFPNGSSVVDSSWVYDCINLRSIPFITGKNDIRYNVQILAADSSVVHIGYREKHNGKIAHYILTTTKYWNRPLLEASYSLFVPHYITVTDFSYLPDKTIKQPNGTLYLLKKNNFMPTQDFIVSFHL
jgi:hypothetical protein